ncbi:MAG TPA: penicillin-insensitive murein endopeptidase [Polyangiaceae bacterium]
MRAASLAFAALATTLTFSTGAFPRAAPRHEGSGRTARAGLGPAALRFGRSIGSPTEGHLLGGSHLDETPYLRVVPVYTANDVRWGLEPLVTMIDRAARQVRRQFPDAITSVGHLSREGGGDIDRHRSHESGRDADVAFFIKSAGGRQLLPGHFIPFRGDGTAPTWPGAFFDDAKNWALVSAFVTDPDAHVTHLFVAVPLRARLLAYAERMGVAPAIRVRAAELLQQPHGSLPHDDHFHVRIGCPARMGGCVENPAMRPRHPPPALAHGRRGPQGRSVVTPAPTAHGSTLPPLPTQAPPAAEPREHDDDSDSEPDAPPAAMTAPIDDVDG